MLSEGQLRVQESKFVYVVSLVEVLAQVKNVIPVDLDRSQNVILDGQRFL
jgi:hypothetical protein